MVTLKNEPVMAVAVLLAAILGAVGVIVDTDTLFNVLVIVVPLVGGMLQRSKVTPVGKDSA